MARRSSAPARGAVLVALLCVVGLLGVLAGSGSVWAAFSAPARNAGNELRAAPDFVAPTASTSTVQKSTGGTPGFLRSGAGYRVYAAVTDTGRPPSGTASVTATLSPASLGLVGAPLTAGTYPAVAGQTYSHRSAAQTLGTAAAGTYPLSLVSTDVAGNGRTQAGAAVVVDNTAPTPTGVRTANRAGGIVGRPEAGDSITFTYSEPVDPISLVPGWDGAAAAPVVVRLTNGGVFANDSLAFYNATNTTALAVGAVDLGRTNYTSGARTFGASGTPSTLTIAGNEATITFGTASGGTTTTTATGTLRWTPGTGTTDRAGNPVGSAALVESGTADRDF